MASGLARRAFLHLCSRIRVGGLTLVLPGGAEHRFGDLESPTQGRLEVHDESLFPQLLSQGEWGLGWGYVHRQWTSESPYHVALVLMLNEAVFRDSVRILGRLAPAARAVTRASRRKNARDATTRRQAVSEAYDVGNDFFRWMLGPSMTYTVAIWPRPGASLEEAQENKLRIVTEKAAIEPHHRVLDIGCGWGTLCNHIQQKTGARVKGIALAREQIEFAKRHYPSCEFEYLNVDDLTGTYDRIVSVGMGEHVGRHRYDGFLKLVADHLVPGGRFVFDTMQSYEGLLMKSGSQRWDSFASVAMPNADVPSMAAIVRGAMSTGTLRILHSETFGIHYAQTAACWLENVRAHRERIVAAYSEAFYRIYEYSWSMGMAAMETGLTTVQVVFEKAPYGAPYASYTLGARIGEGEPRGA